MGMGRVRVRWGVGQEVLSGGALLREHGGAAGGRSDGEHTDETGIAREARALSPTHCTAHGRRWALWCLPGRYLE